MSQSIIELDKAHVWHPFTQHGSAPDPIEIVSGKGAVLTSRDGKEYLDMVSSWWVNIHGHAHPAIAGAIAEQAHKLEQVIFAGFTHEPAATLSAKLAEHLPGDLNRVFFSDDGSTSVEVALKCASQYWLNKGQKRSRFFAFEGGYHGDTVGAMSAGRASGFFDAFDSMMFEVNHLPYPETWDGDPDVEVKEAACLAALDQAIGQHTDEYSALIMEPLVQGAGGMRMCRPEFLQAVEARLRAAGILLIFDEVMTGFGRTGKLFACIRANVTPDLICLSKGLTAGFLAMSVTVCSERIFQAFWDDGFEKAFLHGHSFTANPLGCAAGLASLKLFDETDVMERIADLERCHTMRLPVFAEHPRVKRARVTGTILAFDVETDDGGYESTVGPRLKAIFHDKGLLIRPLGNVVYLLPPYCVTRDQLEAAYDGMFEALDQV